MCVCAQSLSCVWLFVTPWTVAHQAPLSKRFPRQEYWSGLPFPSSGELPDPGTELTSPALASEFFTTQPPEKPWHANYPFYNNNTWLSQIGDTENIPSWQNEVPFLHLLDDTLKKNDKDVFIYKYYYLLKILHSWVSLLEFKAFYSGEVSGWKGKSHGQSSLLFYWLTVSS